jgi:hypothetical protein
MRGPNERFIPRILGARAIPAGQDEYGQLKGGFVRLVGKIKPAFTRGEALRARTAKARMMYMKGK